MPTTNVTENAVTIIFGQPLHRGVEKEFLAWQHEVNDAASGYPGFIGAEVVAPTDAEPDWVVIYRFDSNANLRGWLNSSTRQEYLATGRKYFDGTPTQQILGGVSKAADQLMTVVITHHVRPEDTEAFLSWQKRLQLAQKKFQGYRGDELFRPIEGMQDAWTVLYRYDSVTSLEAWLASDERKELLEEGEKFRDFELKTVDNSFGSWFAFDDKGNQVPPPSDIKTSFAVWVGIYPTVMLLMIAFSPLKMPIWLGTLTLNLCSSFILTFVTMPFFANVLLKRFLWPPPGEPKSRTNLRGAAIVIASLSFSALVFFLISHFLHLP